MRTRIAVLAAFTVFTFIALAALAGSSSDHFSYVFSQGDHKHTVSRGNLEEVLQKTRRYTGTFVWVRRDGREYLIRDAATLAEAKSAFADLTAYEDVARAAEERARPYEKKMQSIEKRMDRLGDSLDDESLSDASRSSIEAQLHPLEQEMAGLEREMETIERDIEKVEKEVERREKIAERKFEQLVERAIDEGRAARLE